MPVAEPGLIEMDIGEVEQLPFAEVRSRYPGLLEAWAGADGPSQPMPGGESLVDVQERAWRTVKRLSARHEAETVCAVTHNFVILTVLATALGTSLAHFRRIRHGLAAVSVIEMTGDRVRVRRMNDSCHLEGADNH
jgi:broad specificity phosphatase PhoE